MNKYMNRLVCLLTLTTMMASCKKEGEQFVIEPGSFPVDGFSSSSANIILTQPEENNNAVTFSWKAASFGQKPVIKYTLQLDVPSDTAGANGWANAKNFDAGANAVSYSFIVKELNSVINSMGLPTATPNNIVLRVKADVPQYNGTASSIAAVYTNSIGIKITSYSLKLYIPGEYQGWDPPSAPLLNQVEGRTGMHEAYVYMPGSGIKYFKYTNAPDWNHINYGDGGNGTFSIDGLAGGLSVPDGGYYELTANLNTNKWTAVKTTWSIIGDATPGGWNADTQMSYDVANQVWKVTCDMVSTGSFKFRANNDWVIDFGIDPVNGKLKYADNPFLGFMPGLNNLSVALSGNYTITLDLHNSQNYTYTLVKN